MKQYLDLVRHILENGVEQHDRTGVGTRAVFGYQMRFSMADGFPLVTTNKLHLRSIIHELLWLLNGDTNVRYLQEKRARIGVQSAASDDKLGPVSGNRWGRRENGQ